MEPIKANFLLIKAEENIWDVGIFGQPEVLKAFEEIYHGFYVEKSVFDQKPMCVIPEFPNKIVAEAWKVYWLDAFADPDNACKTCATVQNLFKMIEKNRANE